MSWSFSGHWVTFVEMGFSYTCGGGKDPKNDFPGLSEDGGDCLPLSGVPFPGTVHLPLKKGRHKSLYLHYSKICPAQAFHNIHFEESSSCDCRSVHWHTVGRFTRKESILESNVRCKKAPEP